MDTTLKILLFACCFFIPTLTLSAQEDVRDISFIVQDYFNSSIQNEIVKLIDDAPENSYEKDYWQMTLADIIDNREELLVHLVDNSYGKYLKRKDMVKAAEFYKTETGKKLLKFRAEVQPSGIIEENSDYFTSEEHKKIKKFYKTGHGKTLFFYSKLIHQDLDEAGVKWIEGRTDMVMERVDKLNEQRFEMTPEGCKLFHEGKFKTTLEDGKEILIERKDGVQIENFQGEVFKMKIEWINDCKYALTDLQEDNTLRLNEILVSNIYEINKTKSFMITATSHSGTKKLVRTEVVKIRE